MHLNQTESRHRPFRIPRDANVTEREREAAAELWSDLLLREERDRREREQAVAVKLRHRRERLDAALGDETAAALRRLKLDFRQELLRRRRLPHGCGTTYDQQHDQWTEALRGLLDRHHLRPEMLREPFADLLEDLVTLAPHADLYADYDVIVPPAAPSNPWVTHRPPFTGWQSGFDTGLINDFSFGRTELLHAESGHVGNILTLDCSAADNFSCGSIWADTQVAFWYRAPVTGLVEVNIVAHCGEARHFLHVRDEWGVSDYGVSQKSYLMMHAIHGNVRGPTYAEVSALRADGDLSTWRDEQHILPGETVSATLASDSPVAAGDQFVIRAGSRSDDGIIVNDMAVTSRTAFSWFLSQVNVRIKV